MGYSFVKEVARFIAAMSFDHELVSHIIHGQHVAAKSMLLECKYLFKFIDNSGQTLLHVSAKHGNAQVSQFLIECGCQVNAQDKLGATPLMLAVSDAMDDATVKALLDANADIHLMDFGRSSSLRKVIKMSQTWLERFIAHGSCKQTKYYRILKMFFSKVEEEFAFNKQLMTNNLREVHCPLALVMFMGNVSVTKYLLKRGYPLNERLRNWSTLHIAVLLMDLDNVRCLIEFGADVNDRDNLDETALFLYDRHDDDSPEQLEIMKLLLNSGASLTIARSDGVTLMEYLFTAGKKNTLMALVQSDSDELTKRTLDGKTPLHFWVENRNRDTDTAIELLLSKRRVDLNAADNDGVTALVKALNAGLLNKMNLLVELGAKVNFIDIFDKTRLFDGLIDPIIGYDAKYAKILDILLHRANPTPQLGSTMNFTLRLHRDKNFRLAKMMLEHLVLDEARGENISVHAFAKLQSRIELREYYESCKLQLQDFKTRAVYESVTLCKLLTESQEKITLYARNNDFIARFEEFMESKSCNDFIYFDHLRKRLDNAIELAILRREASRAICKITRLYPDPNDNIFYKMVKCMSEQDLRNLMEV